MHLIFLATWVVKREVIINITYRVVDRVVSRKPDLLDNLAVNTL